MIPFDYECIMVAAKLAEHHKQWGFVISHVTASVFHIWVLTLLLGDDSNLLWNFLNMSGPLYTY